jgi:hypothetical protein
MRVSSLHGSVHKAESTGQWVVAIDCSITEFGSFEDAMDWYLDIMRDMKAVLDLKSKAYIRGRGEVVN